MISVAHRLESAGTNEDRLFVERRGRRILAMVCDGMGNGGKGALAAEMAIAALTGHTGFLDCQRLLLSLDQKIHCEAGGAESTCVLIEMSDDGQLRGASVGDSCAWLLGRKCVELTAGQDRARLGSGHCAPRVFRGQLLGQLLIATDGLKYVRPDLLPSLAGRGVDALVDAVRLKGSGALPDDLAVILVQ